MPYHSLTSLIVTLLMGNDVAGGKVIPALEVLDSPQRAEMGNENNSDTSLFPSCAITRGEAIKLDNVSLSDTVLMSAFSW